MPCVAGAALDGKVKPKHSIVAGETLGSGGLDVGEIAANAADGCLYVGTTTGAARSIPGAAGITQIVTLTQSQYDAITATASATTLYIVTPS